MGPTAENADAQRQRLPLEADSGTYAAARQNCIQHCSSCAMMLSAFPEVSRTPVVMYYYEKKGIHHCNNEKSKMFV
jgi:hypothetical protein